MAFFDRCLTVREEETEWRDVKLRFQSDTLPVPGQLGSLDNSIKTSKYTLASWIPKGTFEQFRRLANVYFLGISLMMIVGTYTELYENSIQYYTTLGPLIVIISFTLVKEGLEDKKRHASDNEVNSRKAEVVTLGQGTVSVAWRSLQPGMVVLVKDREEFPADLVCLASADAEGKCYIETANIDGETNLKLRKCAACNAQGNGPGWTNTEALLHGVATGESVSISFEPPNPSIHTFGGTVNTNAEAAQGGNRVQAKAEAAPCGASELCLRGAILRNTKWILGVVVYTGQDTKLVMNSREVPSKMSTIEQTVNQMIYFILLADVVLTTVSTLARALWNGVHADNTWYLCDGKYKESTTVFADGCDEGGVQFSDASYWATFFILFNNFLPLSLYVTLEIVNFVQAYYVDQDVEMYDEQSDTPASARTSNQNGDLGQIEYVFSDKTGTLTCNEMKFRRCSCGGEVFGNVVPGGDPAQNGSGGSNGADSGSSGDIVGGGGGVSMVVSPLSAGSMPRPPSLKPPTPPGSGDDGDDDDGAQQQRESVSMDNVVRGQPLELLKAKARHPNSLNAEMAHPPSLAAQVMGELLATCHNVVVERDQASGSATYQAESPDEEALVEGGAVLGYTYLGATSDSMTVGHEGQGSVGGATANSTKQRCYKLLASIPFDSSRKRMSVLVVTPEGVHRLLTKGADNVMFDRAGDFELCGGQELLDEHLEGFSNEGLRTLVLGFRDLPLAEATEWLSEWNRALTLPNREEACERVAGQVEVGLSIVGATAIEDRLQQGVPETIADLKNAGIKVWVLTGDKMTTAINIGFSARLLTQDMELVTLDKESAGDGRPHVLHRLKQAYEKYASLTQHKSVLKRFRKRAQRFQHTLCCQAGLTDVNSVRANGGRPGEEGATPTGSGPSRVNLHELDTDHLALVVDGPSLLDILANKEATHMLLQLGCFCKAVIACRVSPAQKQLLVKMVKEGLPHKPITLSIGDGANDVPMIQEAQIGVGISGKEGRQAVNSSDFAIAQFRFLKRLLLVHGRYNYRRISKVIIYSFYKNIVLVIVLFLFSCFSAFSGQSLYGANSWCYSGYNFFLGLPPFMLGFFDRDVKPRSAMTFHKLYYAGLHKQDLNVSKITEAFLTAILDAVVIYFLTMASYQQLTWQSNGKTSGINTFGNSVLGVMVFAMLYKVCLLFSSWNAWSVFSIVFSVAFYLVFIFSYSAMGPVSSFGDFGEYDFFDVPYHMFGVAGFWLTLLLVPTSSLLFHYLLKALRIEIYVPRDVVVAEHEHLTRHLSPAERDALVRAAAQSKAAASSASSTGGGSARGSVGTTAGASGGGGVMGAISEDEGLDDDAVAEELESPKVKVDASVMAGLHSTLTDSERDAFMGNTKLRSSFVDNAPASQSYFAGGHRPEPSDDGQGGGAASGLGRRSVSGLRSSAASTASGNSDDARNKTGFENV